ncbi:hypothetical protein ESCO_006748 [Escovopsis weberi]|uniref:DEUBAD domain-containing protein n=1 Tax=Escovopsis weberi TaxID=150374 RepID=A0A0M9VVT5_ESCWE|nr:hypothetical protein ESCO_006748 [Escovopsis weberi]
MTGKKQSPRKPKWDAERILTDPKSPLARANLRTILSHPMAWSVLDAEEKAEILSLFPDKEHILDPDTDDARPDLRSLLNDDSFRYDCAAYTTNLALGRHDPEWLASAWGAQERRRIGDFDEFLIGKLRDDWGVELPDEMKLFRTPAQSAVPDEREGVPATNGSGCLGGGAAGEMRMDLEMPEDKVS